MLLVAGSGRSGTSTFTGIMKLLGMHVPQPEVPADATNPRGFSEPQWVVDFHTRLLRRSHVDMQDSRPSAWELSDRVSATGRTRQRLLTWLAEQFASRDNIIVKDPRLSWFLPLWMDAAASVNAAPGVVMLLRRPTEVIGSKKRYYGTNLMQTQLAAAWVNMVLESERRTRGSARALVRYDELTAQPRTVVRKLADRLDLRCVQTAAGPSWSAVDRFVDPTLRRVTVTWADLAVPDPLRDVAEATWESLVQLASTPAAAEPRTLATLDELRAAYVRYYAECEAVAASSIRAARAATAVRDLMPPELERRIPASLRRRLSQTYQAVATRGDVS